MQNLSTFWKQCKQGKSWHQILDLWINNNSKTKTKDNLKLADFYQAAFSLSIEDINKH